ncbi:helix-turn-helix transcriptional regulator [Burkholderia sp. 22PA0106]|uniref:helix-turn-helix transcriptional regulator n=1 Tax=Burkholderia sp. 22PA0106 TaxID=3237371 RepID=UPI0039C17094
MNENSVPLQRILRLKRVKEKTGISGSSIYNKINHRSKYYDEEFPKPIRLSAGAVGWSEAEIDKWIALRMRERANCE